MIGRLIIDDVSQLLHVSKDASEIYVILLKHGVLTEKKVMKLLDLSEKAFKKAIEKLTIRNLVILRQDSKNQTILETTSIMQLEEKLDRDMESLSNLKNTIVPSIQPIEKINLVRYEGFEGIRKVYIEVLEEAIKTNEPILAFESIPDKEDSPIGKIFLENYLTKRLENNIEAKIIAPATQASKEYKESNENNLTQAKLLEDFNLKNTINITGDLVMSYSINPPLGTLRRNPLEAGSLKAIFNKIWKN